MPVVVALLVVIGVDFDLRTFSSLIRLLTGFLLPVPEPVILLVLEPDFLVVPVSGIDFLPFLAPVPVVLDVFL